MTIDLFRTHGTTLLVGLESIWNDAGVALPDRRYFYSGQIAFDCAQLTVSINRVSTGQPGRETPAILRASLPFTRTIVFRVELVREVCGINDSGLPEVTDLEEDAKMLAKDGYLMFVTLTDKAAAGTLFGDACKEVVVSGVTPIGPEGGLAGWRCDVSLSLT